MQAGFFAPYSVIGRQEKRPELLPQPLIFVSATLHEVAENQEGQQQERHQAATGIHEITRFFTWMGRASKVQPGFAFVMPSA